MVAELGRILIADNDECFLRVTAGLLHKDNHRCECTLDASSAAKKLHSKQYDLLIADLDMPGSARLELIHNLPETAEGLRAIVVTEQPSIASAIEAIHLPVSA